MQGALTRTVSQAEVRLRHEKRPATLPRALSSSSKKTLLNRVGRSLEAVHSLLGHPLQHALGVIAVGEDVVAGRQTVRRTLLLHLVQLGVVEFRIFNRAPVMRG